MNHPESEFSSSPFLPGSYTAFLCDAVVENALGYQFYYRLQGPQVADVVFMETLLFEDEAKQHSLSRSAALEKVAGLLHQIAGVSYYKTAAPPTIVVPGKAWDSHRSTFLQETYTKGLAEFAFVNGLELSCDFHGHGDGRSLDTDTDAKSFMLSNRKVLLPFGGGKDSLLSLQLLVAAGFEPTLLVVGPNLIAEDLARKTRMPLITVGRILDPKLSHLNQFGALNGHVPVTAVISVIAVLAALRGEFSAVVMSNERSANVGTKLHQSELEVNHQYSKGLAFEDSLRGELDRCGLHGLDYFSLLRPFSELSICRAFAQRGQHFDGFVSCNKNFRRSDVSESPSWCMACPKCLFVQLAMAPFLSEGALLKIFGSNALQDVSMLASYAALLEVEGGKRPFDCVGGAEETHAAFSLLARHEEGKFYAVVEHYLDKWSSSCPEGVVEAVLLPTDHHLVPTRFYGALDAVS